MVTALKRATNIQETPLAITAGTSHGADLIGNPDIGSLQVGKLADIVAVSGGPLADTSAIPRVDIVYSYGGAGGEPITALVDAGVKGIVTAGTGAGGLSDD